jgi:hypothetical protein
MFFTEEELAEFQNSSLITNTKARIENSKMHYEQISKILWPEEDSWEEPLFNVKKFSLKQWQWSLSMLWSRAFSVKIDGIPMGSLVPFADMFNAMDPYSQPVQVRASLTGNSLQYHSTINIKQGEEIFMPYGKFKNLSNAELIMDYGYVRSHNPDDIACVANPFEPLDPHAEGFSLKTAILGDLQLWQ